MKTPWVPVHRNYALDFLHDLALLPIKALALAAFFYSFGLLWIVWPPSVILGAFS